MPLINIEPFGLVEVIDLNVSREMVDATPSGALIYETVPGALRVRLRLHCSDADHVRALIGRDDVVIDKVFSGYELSGVFKVYMMLGEEDGAHLECMSLGMVMLRKVTVERENLDAHHP